jgi:CHAT domain-containing protein
MVAERARARLLLELMAGRDASRPAASPVEEVRRRIRARYEERAALARPQERSALDRELSRLTDSLALLEGQPGARHPTPASIGTIRTRLLGEERALLTFFWGDNAVYGWWVSGDTIRSARLGSSDSLATLLEFLRQTIDRPGDDPSWIEPARRVFDRLVAPLEPTPVDEVLVVADGPLAHIPLEVLVPPKGVLPWAAATQFVYGPSASVLLSLVERPPEGEWDRAVLAVGNPTRTGRRPGPRTDSGGMDSAMAAPLPYAAREALEIRDLFRDAGADLLLGPRATPARWLGLHPPRYRYLHFAAHARVSDQRADETYLVLSGGNLDLPVIRGLRLSAELVTLSACETALGRRVRGEGIIGLPHAFLAAGARGTIVTLWRIADRSAADFMAEFYRELHAGHRPANALLIVRRRWITSRGSAAHPSRWAPFILVGGINPPASLP